MSQQARIYDPTHHHKSAGTVRDNRLGMTRLFPPSAADYEPPPGEATVFRAHRDGDVSGTERLLPWTLSESIGMVLRGKRVIFSFLQLVNTSPISF